MRCVWFTMVETTTMPSMWAGSPVIRYIWHWGVFGFLGGCTKDSELFNIEEAATVSEDDICDAKKAYLCLLKWGDQQRIDEASKFVDLVSDSDPEDPVYIDSPTIPKKHCHLKNNNIKATKTTALAMNLSSPSKAKLTKTHSYWDLATFKSDHMDKDGSVLVNYHQTGNLAVKVRASIPFWQGCKISAWYTGNKNDTVDWHWPIRDW